MGLAIPPADACRTDGYSTVPSPFSMDDTTFRGLGHRLVDTLADLPGQASAGAGLPSLAGRSAARAGENEYSRRGSSSRGCHRRLSPAGAAIRPWPESSVFRCVR